MSPKLRSFISHQLDVRPAITAWLRRTCIIAFVSACFALTTAGAPGEQAINNLTSKESIEALGGWKQEHLSALVAIAAIGGLVLSQSLSMRHTLKVQHEANQPYRELAESIRAMAVSVSDHRAAIDRRPCGFQHLMKVEKEPPPA